MRYNDIINEHDHDKYRHLFDEDQVRVIDVPDFSDRLKRSICELKHGAVSSLFGMPATFNGSIWLDFPKLRSLKHAPQEVSGGFTMSSDIGMPEVTSLVGGPKTVTGNCTFDNVGITNLVGAPRHVGDSFKVNGIDKLMSIQGAPNFIGHEFTISHCHSLTTLKDIHKYVKHCKSFLLYDAPICSHIMGLLLIPGLERVRTKIWSKHTWNTQAPKGLHTAMEIVSKHLGKGHDGLLDCQIDLIEAGLAEYAQL